MKHKRLILALVVTIVILAILAAITLWPNPKASLEQGTAAATPQLISGRVTATDNGCYADAICSVTLDDIKVIITGCGLQANGTTCKTYDQSKLVQGQQVEATVIKAAAENYYNLECDSCTIRPLAN
jgi:hypothetical protein